VFSTSFLEKKTSTMTYCFYYLVEFSVKFPTISVNIKQIYQKELKKYYQKRL